MSQRVFSNQLLEGARNCILNCGNVGRGMNVLILNMINDLGNPVDETAVHALATVAQEAGANVQILWTTGMEKGWWSDVPPIVGGAFSAADLVINNTLSIGRPLKAVRELMFGKGISESTRGPGEGPHPSDHHDDEILDEDGGTHLRDHRDQRRHHHPGESGQGDTEGEGGGPDA